jgi:hypothetical protein
MGKGSLHVKPSFTSDKRDDVLPARYVLADVPFVILRPGPLARLLPAGARSVVFRKLSKLPNKEDA